VRVKDHGPRNAYPRVQERDPQKKTAYNRDEVIRDCAFRRTYMYIHTKKYARRYRWIYPF